ncbi:Telomerase reverse transcriptase (Telomerase catalytic subunit) [Durusdinium trenchii]|uniref:Telomerase reverse transcriptase n=1 Tax=Durusdinium trenchii TaxID=1381693 RepID=A0ABP0IZ19_9DINO
MIRRWVQRRAAERPDRSVRVGQLKARTVSAVSWDDVGRDHRIMAEVLGRLCYFIFSHLAVPLLRAHFYATEAEPGGMQTIYFRTTEERLALHALAGGLRLFASVLEPQRDDIGLHGLAWAKGLFCESLGPRLLVRSSSWEVSGFWANLEDRPVPPGLRRLRAAASSRATPRVRWVPKRRGFRPLLSGLAKSEEVYRKLLDALVALKTIWKDGAAPELFVAVADLRHCYDQIMHEPLLRRIQEVPLQPKYWIVPVSLQRPGALLPRAWDLALPEGTSLQEVAASPQCPLALQRDELLVAPRCAAQRASGMLEVSKTEVLRLLTSVVRSSEVQLDTQRDPSASCAPKYRFTRGIPQGSHFSPFLCALHMSSGDAQLPAEVLESLRSHRSALVRLVDDFLFISTDAARCCDFLSCLAQPGNPYGGDLNRRKVAANFRLLDHPNTDGRPRFRAAGPKRRRVDAALATPRSVEVPWAGLTLTPEHGLINLRQNTQRRVCDALAVRKVRKVAGGREGLGRVWENTIRSKLLIFLKMKLTPLLLDPRLNSDACVQSSLARLTRCIAWRFAWLLTQGAPRRLPHVTPSYVTRQTKRLVRYAAQRAEVVRDSGVSDAPSAKLHARWVVLDAFHHAWRPRRSSRRQRHNQNLPLLAMVAQHGAGRAAGDSASGPKTCARARRAALARARMDHVVSCVVDLSLRTYRACMPNSLAAKGLQKLLFGLGYSIKKGDLAGIPWKDWRAFEPDEQAFHKDTGYLKALLAAAFSDQLLLGAYGVVKKELDLNGTVAKKQLEGFEVLQKLMKKHHLSERETMVFAKGAVEDAGAYVEFVCGSRPRQVIKEEGYVLVQLGLDAQSEAARWRKLASLPSAMMVSPVRLPAEFNLISQFEKHMRDLARIQATAGWTYKPVTALHPHFLKWEWMEPLFTAKGQPLRCEGMLEKKNSVGVLAYVQPLTEGHLKPVASFAVAANVRGGQGPTNSYPEAVTVLSPGHIAFVLSTCKMETSKLGLRRFGFTTSGELAVLHRCVNLPSGCLYGAVWEKVRALREALRQELKFEMPSKDTPVLYDSDVTDLTWDLFQAVAGPMKGEEATLALDRDGVQSVLSNTTVNLLKQELPIGVVPEAFLPVAEWPTLVQRRQELVNKINCEVKATDSEGTGAGGEGGSIAEYVTPAKRPRLKLRLSEPKVPRPSNAENPQDAEAKGGRARTLMETPSRREGLSEEQERRFRMAVCKSSDEVLGALLCGLEQEDALALKRSEVQRAQIHAYHAVQLYFTMKSFQSSNIEAATLLAAWKAVKDTRILVSAERFVQVLQEQEVALEALGLHPTQWLTEEAMNLERWANGASISRCVDLSLVDGLAQRWVQRLQRDEELHGDAVLKLRETARTLVVEAMLGPAPLMFPPVTLAAAATTLGVMKSLDALKASSEEIKGRIKKEQTEEDQKEMRPFAAFGALKSTERHNRTALSGTHFQQKELRKNTNPKATASTTTVGHLVATPNLDYEKHRFQLNREKLVGHVCSIFALTATEDREAARRAHQWEARLLRPYFGCESDLINLLLQSGLGEERVLELFWQHRTSYVSPIDFARIRALGLKKIRLPLTWCINYDQPYRIKGKTFGGQDQEVLIGTVAAIVKDPFENDPAFNPKGMGIANDRWVSIPIQVVEHVLEVAADFGLQVLLDLHAFPGGSSAGTFNGVWPLNPRFWTAHCSENFTTIMVQILNWMNGLSSKNPKAFKGLYGLTPMNEPAHMRGLYDTSGAAVPVPYQEAYDELGLPGWANVSTQQILQTLQLSVEEFRRRPALASQGVRLLMNVIETAFAGTFGGTDDAKAFAASQTGEVGSVTGALGAWWKEITTESERQTWAVLDLHNYIAWNPEVKNFEEIATMEDYRRLLSEMSLPFFQQLRSRLQMPKPQLLACSEYSASTNQDTLLSVTSSVGRRPRRLPWRVGWHTLRDEFLRGQHRAAKEEKIDMWFWTYHIRKNRNYQGEWSLQHVLSPWPRLLQSFGPLSLLRCVGHLSCTCGWLLLYGLRRPWSFICCGFGWRFVFRV